MKEISAQTDLYCLLGFPIDKSLSPQIQNAALKAFNIDGRYLAFNVMPADFKKALTGLKVIGVKGMNITIPHKVKVLSLLEEISAEAKMIGSVNTIAKLNGENLKYKGYNTDGEALILALKQLHRVDPQGSTAFVIGAGGSARACLFALAQNKVGRLIIFNRSSQKGIYLQRNIKHYFPHLKVEVCYPRGDFFFDDLQKILLEIKPDILVNTTPVQFWPAEFPFHKNQLVVDLVYHDKTGTTLFLDLAIKKGAKTVNGLTILLFQGAKAFSIWTGLEPPIAIMEQTLAQGIGGFKDGS